MTFFTRTALSVVGALLATTAMSQNLGVLEFSFSSGPNNTVPPNQITGIPYTIRNYSSTAIPAGSVFVRTVSRGLTPIIGPDNITLVNGLAGNTSASFVANGTYEFGGGPLESVCVSAILVVGEIDTTNNVLCQTCTVSSAVSNDLALHNLTIDSPTDLDSFDVDNGTNIPPLLDIISFDLINNGQVVYVSGTNLEYELSLDGDNVQLFGQLGADLEVNDTITLTSSDSLYTLIDSPDEEGFYTLCIALEQFDVDPDNDTSCTSFSIIDTYTPPWPIGINEVNENAAVVSFQNDQLHVSNVPFAVEFMVSDAQGKVLGRYAASSDFSVDASTWPSGVYNVQAPGAFGNAKAVKVVKP